MEHVFAGAIDLQVNGCCGVDFNNPDITVEEVRKACEYQWRTGTVKFLPTIVSNPKDVIIGVLSRIKEAMFDELIGLSIPGVHLEIYPALGAIGCHNPNYLQNPDWSFIEGLGELSRMVRIITLAPELEGAIGFIKQAIANGIVIALGHTLADYETIRGAWFAGASLSTHLGNGIPAVLPRNDNPINSQLFLAGLGATFIADGFHIPSHVLKSYIRQGASAIVTDSISAAGIGEGAFQLAGKDIVVSGGKASPKGRTDILAGSVASMLDMIGNLIDMGFSPQEIGWLISKNPAGVLRLSPTEVSQSEVRLEFPQVKRVRIGDHWVI